MMNQTTKNDMWYVEREFDRVKRACKPYGYQVFLRFDEIHIRTRCEAWYYIPKQNQKSSLMHGNGIGVTPDSYHKQFTRYINVEKLVEYIRDHETWKYMGVRVPVAI